jgi:hypothetical protein
MAADSLDVALSFYESLIPQFSLKTCIELVGQLWDRRDSNENFEVILFSISDFIPRLDNFDLKKELLFTEYADILRALGRIPYEWRVKKRLTFPEAIMREWFSTTESFFEVDENLPVFALMSADFLGPNILKEVVSSLSGRITTKELLDAIAKIAEMNQDFLPAHRGIVDRILDIPFPLTNLDYNRDVKPYIKRMEQGNVAVAAKMTDWMFRSFVTRNFLELIIFPDTSIVVPSATHWEGVVEQLSEHYRITYNHQISEMGSVDNSRFIFPLDTHDLFLILLHSEEGDVFAVEVQNDISVNEYGIEKSYLVSFANPRSEFDQGVTLENLPYTIFEDIKR